MTPALPARTDEAGLVDLCAAVALGSSSTALDSRAANVCRVSAMILGQRHRTEAGRLMRASNDYFAGRPAEQLPPAEVVRLGLVSSLPRLRELLEARLSR